MILQMQVLRSNLRTTSPFDSVWRTERIQIWGSDVSFASGDMQGRWSQVLRLLPSCHRMDNSASNDFEEIIGMVNERTVLFPCSQALMCGLSCV